MRRIARVVCCLAVVGWAVLIDGSLAHATLIEYQVAGVVIEEELWDPLNALGGLEAGDPFTAIIRYDSDWGDLVTEFGEPDPHFASYGPPALVGNQTHDFETFSLTINQHTFRSVSDTPAGVVVVNDFDDPHDFPDQGKLDQITIRPDFIQTPVQFTGRVVDFGISLVTRDTSVLPDKSLPKSIHLEQWDGAFAFFTATFEDDAFVNMNGQITGIKRTDGNDDPPPPVTPPPVNPPPVTPPPTNPPPVNPPPPFIPVGPLRPGDADRDLDVDMFDIVQVQVAGKYLTGLPATWGEGDWDGGPGGDQLNPPPGDGLFNQRDIIAALLENVYLTGPYAALSNTGQANDAQTSIGYDAATGEVWVDAPNGVELTSVNVDSTAGIFTGEAAQNLGGSFDNEDDANIFKATFGGSFGSLSFGHVAQSGLSQQFLLDDLTVVGSLQGGGDLGDVDLIYVPEPCVFSSALLGIGLAMTGLRRRSLARIAKVNKLNKDG